MMPKARSRRRLNRLAAVSDDHAGCCDADVVPVLAEIGGKMPGFCDGIRVFLHQLVILFWRSGFSGFGFCRGVMGVMLWQDVSTT
jgi:hypothetical protein